MKKLLIYFVQGLVITVPVAITAIVIYKVITFVGSFVFLFGPIVSPIIDPIIVIAITLLIILLLGLLGSTIIFRPIFSMLDNALEHTPVVKTIYTSIKDFLSAFVGSKKRFNKPVLLMINKENNIQQLGFITQEDLGLLKMDRKSIAVYVPLSYSFSGNLLIVPVENVTPVKASSTEVMKFIVSGGVTDID